jgi:hypothetical protein
LGKLFRHLVLTRLMMLHKGGRLSLHDNVARLIDRRAFPRHLSLSGNKNRAGFAKASCGRRA